MTTLDRIAPSASAPNVDLPELNAAVAAAMRWRMSSASASVDEAWVRARDIGA